MSARRVLVVMAKAPRPSHVKTRLQPRISTDQAAALYRCFLEDTLALVGRLRGVRIAIMCPLDDRAAFERLIGPDIQVASQTGDGLAAGLTSVFRDFAAAGFDRIVAFNADSPHIPPAFLESAFEALDSHETVVGPTSDGGYYLVGATRAHPGLFGGDRLGSASALESLVARLRTLSLTMAMLPPCYDVDDPDDLARLEADLRVDPQRAPHTAALLARWRARS
ncbi:MAG: TIGR04282 family arsenosugar biosynthesis glycosyltransferase [Vicinamibacterales bacterium]